MAKSVSVIEVNGNRYDAVTGQVLGAAKKMAAQVKNPASGVIDGLVRKPALSIVSSVKPGLNSVRPDRSNLRQRYKSAPGRRQTQRSQTLMRSLVSKPSGVIKKADSAAKFYKSRTAEISPVRASRAKTVAKNAKVEHFGKSAPKNPESFTRPRLVSRSSDRALVTLPQAKPMKAVAAPLPSMVTSVSHQNLERLLDHALMQADAHKMALRARAKGWRRVMLAPKWLSIGATSVAFALLVGFFAWQNIPQVSIRLANARAHVSASVPAYTPMGYGVTGPIKADSNQVTINYKAASQNKGGYAITQQASNWDSSSVAANAVPSGTQVQSSQVNGTTVYIYGQSNDATWVNHGVLFNLQDKANLSSDQILKIANGL